VLRTPLRRSDWLSDEAGGDIFLKIETIQPTFSYKIRGAFNAVRRLLEHVRPSRSSDLDTPAFFAVTAALNADLDPGVSASAGSTRLPSLVTASAGNHGRALAHAAREAALHVTVYAPASAPRVKLDAIRALGAELRTCADYDEAERQAKAHGADPTATYVSPYSHPDVIAGAGTIASEILEDEPEIDTIVVPIGGGGLISGIAIACGSRRDGRATPQACRVTGVEVEASSPFTHALRAARIVPIDVRPTLADGLAGNLDPDTITFDIVRDRVDGIALVTERDLQDGVSGLVHRERLIAEGAGAAGVAGVLAGRIDLRGRRAAVVVSGANIDPERLRAII
jgi:threonine dehydratase